jgi:hypothetical protein
MNDPTRFFAHPYDVFHDLANVKDVFNGTAIYNQVEFPFEFCRHWLVEIMENHWPVAVIFVEIPVILNSHHPEESSGMHETLCLFRHYQLEKIAGMGNDRCLEYRTAQFAKKTLELREGSPDILVT